MAGTGRPRSQCRRSKDSGKAGAMVPVLQPDAFRITGRIPGPGARPRKRADVRRVSRDDQCRSSPEPRDTLDALEVNRTEDAVQQVYQDSVRRDRHEAS